MSLTPDMIVNALTQLNRPARASDIHEEIKALYPGVSLGKTPEASIRARLQECCPESSQYKGRRDLFHRASPVADREGLWVLLSPAPQQSIDLPIYSDINKILSSKDIKDTERKMLALARIGQGHFRANLCEKWNGCCAVTGVDIPQLLRASHIKAWKDSDNKERLDPDNGLLLVANIDAAFDKHLVSFCDNGKMLFSKALGNQPNETLGVLPDAKIRHKLNPQQTKYLDQHRKRFDELNK